MQPSLHDSLTGDGSRASYVTLLGSLAMSVRGKAGKKLLLQNSDSESMYFL